MSDKEIIYKNRITIIPAKDDRDPDGMIHYSDPHFGLVRPFPASPDLAIPAPGLRVTCPCCHLDWVTSPGTVCDCLNCGMRILVDGKVTTEARRKTMTVIKGGKKQEPTP